MIKTNTNRLVTTYGLKVIYLCVGISFTISLAAGYAQTKTEETGQKDLITLSEAYDGIFKVGVALNRWQIEGENPQATQLITSHFNTITPENLMKWSRIHPGPDEYTFDAADRFVEFGEKHGMFIVGHTLVWHSQIPDWTFKDEHGDELGREALLRRMKDHISTL